MMACFDLVREAIDLTLKCSCGDFSTIPERIEILEEYCEAIDDVARFSNASRAFAKITDDRLRVVVGFETSYMSAKSKDSILYELIERSTKFTISHVNENKMKVSFEFPSVFKVKAV